MSEVKQIKAVARDRAGKGAARAVRRQGMVPAVIYGAGQPAQAIALDFNQTKQLIFAGHFLTTIFEIDVDGKTTRAIPRDYQLDPVKDFPVHVDFLRLAQGQAIKVVVPVHVVGQDKCPGVKRGGTLQIVEHSVELLVPSDAIPDFIEASVANLDIGSSVHLSDVALPKGAKPTSAENVTLVTVVAPSGMKEEEAAPAAAAEGEAAKA
ncbi:50S ribosomal protein L25/general stress protein Ctc [Microvirga thermotolerans]|uniref:Large ribosomal subunit protein bL25 n=1 Tax=Microvirga thermotolerans TaxID=2651334 RepID=A0A5P9JXF5_9HYPH|nr:50S ribosomal protein L25/general stress protein Ctc [Microvirga thermotolerans]QFU17287.1 50S ribosomal protein L25/general stress protein Ctc [Microvirga thermotolerans]